MSLKKQLIKGSIGSLFIRVLGTGLAFVLSVFLARNLGANDFGLYSFILALITFISIPLLSGFPNLVVRETAIAHSNNDWDKIKGVFYWVSQNIIAYSAVCIMIIFFLYVIDIRILTQDRFHLFIIGSILIPTIPFLLVQGALIRGVGRVVLGIIPDSVLRPGITILFLGIMVLFLETNLNPFNVFCCYIASIIVSILISIFLLWTLTPKEHRDLKIYRKEITHWKKAAYPLSVVGGLQLMYSYIDIILLGFFSSNETVGIYRAIGQLGMLVVFGLSAINQMLHSHFAKLYASKNIKQLQIIVTYSSLIIFMIAAIPGAVFIFAGEFFLKTVFGEEFIAGTLPLIILTIGQLANALFGSVGALLNMTGHEKDAMKGMLYSLFINLFLGFILIPNYGMVGAATSTAISLVVWNTILRYYVKKRLGIESIGFVYLLKRRSLK